MNINIVFLSAVGWSFVAQAQQKMAIKFSERGFNFVYVEPFVHRYPSIGEYKKVFNIIKRFIFGRYSNNEKITKIPDGIRLVTAMGLPETNYFFRLITRKVFVPLVKKKILKGLNRNDPTVIYCWKPQEGFLELVKTIDSSVLIYSCVDDYMNQYKAPANFRTVEKILVKKSDIVIASSELVKERLLTYFERRILIRDKAVDFELFNEFASNKPVKKVKTIGFFGSIGKHIDYDILFYLSKIGYKIFLLGTFKRSKIDLNNPPKNFECHESVPYERVAESLKNVDCFIIPYKMTEKTKELTVTKIYECFATGKPVLATHIPYLKKFDDGCVYFSDTGNGFADILDTMELTESVELHSKRIEIAKKNDWKNRIEEEESFFMERIINDN